MTNPARNRFQVRTEGLPERCEICHQSDRFNPETGECGRCRQLATKPPLIPHNLTVLDPGRVDLPHHQRERLEQALNVDEELVWYGKPTLTIEEEQLYRLPFVIAVSYVGISSFYFLFPESREFFTMFWFFLLFFAFVSVWFFWVIVSPKLNTVFAVTTQRVFALHCGRVTTLHSLSREKIGRMTRIRKEKNSGDLVFSVRTAGVPIPSLTFSDIPDVCEVETIIRRVYQG